MFCLLCLFVCFLFFLAHWVCDKNKTGNYPNLWTSNFLSPEVINFAKKAYWQMNQHFWLSMKVIFDLDFRMEPLISATLSYFNWKMSFEKMKKKNNLILCSYHVTRFRVNLHSVVAWMSRNFLLETGTISEVTEIEPIIT